MLAYYVDVVLFVICFWQDEMEESRSATRWDYLVGACRGSMISPGWDIAAP